MLTAAHVLVYSDDAASTREFVREVLGYPSVDAGDGWLIFRVPKAELGVHPAATDGGHVPAGTVRLSLMCVDLDATIADLRARGIEVLAEPVDAGYGVVATIAVPGGVALDVYEPRHPTAYDLD